MAALRRDAARNRQHVLDVARTFVDEGRPLQLNDVARTAGVGVATVYRHFPAPEALLEAVALPAVERLLDLSRSAAADADPWAGLTRFLRGGLHAQLADPSLRPALTAAEPASAAIAEARRELFATLTTLLARAHAAGAVAASVNVADVVALMCGIDYAAHVGTGGEPSAVSAAADRHLGVVLRGLQP